MNPKISIIVPVYNTMNYIERCVNSLLNQTYQNIEIIIVNDGSTDESWNVIENLKKLDCRIMSICQKNQGVTSARLNGILHASGEWIGFVDSDDEIEPNMYELLIRNAYLYHADISHCGYKLIFPERNRTHFFYNTKVVKIQSNLIGIKDLLEGKLIEPGLCNKLFRKELFYNIMSTDLLDKSIKINEDLLMNYYLFCKSKQSVFIDECLYNYNVRYTSSSRQGMNYNKIYDPIKVRRIILNTIPSELQQVAMNSYISTCVYTFNSLICNKDSNWKDCIAVRRYILNSKQQIRGLNLRIKILAKFIMYNPWLYKYIYRFYSTHLQEHKYN